VSWSAIAQIESGRRKDVRLSSLLALADALQISVDHLVGSKAIVSPPPFRHSALMYRSEAEFVHAAAPFVTEGIERSECVIVITAERQANLLQDALGDAARTVQFKDASDWYRSPSAALNAYRRLLKEQIERGAHWIRIVGEAMWAGEPEAEAETWMRYESLVNLAFASAPASIMCVYDARSAPTNVLADAGRTHPELVHAIQCDPSPDYRPPEDFLLTPRQLRTTV
jgi:transcriptional regulator with XRE-family HTH domain